MNLRSDMFGGRVSPNVSTISVTGRSGCPLDWRFAAINAAARAVILLATVIMFWMPPQNIEAQSKPNNRWNEVRRVAKQEWSVEYSFRTGHDEIGHTYHRLSVNHEGHVKDEITSSSLPKGKTSRLPSISKEKGQMVLDRVIQQLEEYTLEVRADEGKSSIEEVTLRAGRCGLTIDLTEQYLKRGSGIELILGKESASQPGKTTPSKTSRDDESGPPPKRDNNPMMAGCRLFESQPEDWQVVVLLTANSGRVWRLATKHDGMIQISEYETTKNFDEWEHRLTLDKANVVSILTASAKDVSEFSFKAAEKSQNEGQVSVSLILSAKERRVRLDESGVLASLLDATIASNTIKAFRERLPEDVVKRIPVLKPAR